MKLDLNDKKLRMTSLAGLMIYTAVVLKNGGEQMKMKNHFMSSVVGRLLFIGGWGLMAFSISGKPIMKMDSKMMMSYIGALGVIVSVMAMKMLPLSPVQKKPFGLLFIGSWVAVSVAVGISKSKKAKMLGYFALANVLGSMLYILPYARKHNIVDNPGFGMFALTFISLAVANSL